MPIVWILAALAVLFIVETVLTEIEHWGWATVTLIATVVAAHFLHVFRFNEFVMAHGWSTLWYALGYVTIGVGWSFVKWFSYLRNFRDTFRGYKEGFCKSRGLPIDQPVPADQLEGFRGYLARYVSTTLDRSTRSYLIELERPRASSNKRRITAWMAYWPCSVVGTFLNDPVRRFFNWAFNQFKALYQRMSDYVMRKDVELK